LCFRDFSECCPGWLLGGDGLLGGGESGGLGGFLNGLGLGLGVDISMLNAGVDAEVRALGLGAGGTGKVVLGGGLEDDTAEGIGINVGAVKSIKVVLDGGFDDGVGLEHLLDLGIGEDLGVLGDVIKPGVSLGLSVRVLLEERVGDVLEDVALGERVVVGAVLQHVNVVVGTESSEVRRSGALGEVLGEGEYGVEVIGRNLAELGADLEEIGVDRVGLGAMGGHMCVERCAGKMCLNAHMGARGQM